VARITRKELKSDKFAQEVGLTVDFFEEHRKDLARYGAVALVVLVLVAGYMYYARRQHAARQEALYKAVQAAEAPVGAAQGGGLSFPTQQAKDERTVELFTGLASKYGGSTEGDIAEYFLGSIRAGQGKLAAAEKYFLDAAQKGDEKYASLAKLSLAQIYFEDGRADQGEKTLRDLIAHPTIFVSSDQATLSLAQQIMLKKPAEARKLLQPLMSKPGGAGQAATDLNTGIPQ
jgi:predicted negative regulator of RcsB-dependent stress response